MEMDEIIRAFKATESSSQIMPLIDNKELCHLLVVWPKVLIEKVARAKPGVLWMELWDCYDANAAVIGRFLGVSTKRARELILQAQAAQLIYPDNTIHGKAQSYLATVVMKEIPKELRRVREDNVEE